MLPILYPPVVPLEGVSAFMDVLVNAIQNGGLASAIHLYGNDFVPTATTVLADYVECLFGGYGPVPIPALTNAGIDADGRDVWTFPQTVFTATGGGLPVVTYGYWVDFTDPISLTTRVLFSQRFQTPQVLALPGDTVKFALSFGGKQC